MTSIYIKDTNGKKIAVSVTEEIKAVDLETRRAIWRNDAKEKYYRSNKLNNLNEKDREMCSDSLNPEERLLDLEEKAERKRKLQAGLRSLTPEQLSLVRMLKSGMSVTAIAAKLGVDKSAISHRRKRIQEKIKKFLK